MAWTQEMDAHLRILWDQGTSITKIGAIMRVTRNAVAGRARRLNLSKRAAPEAIVMAEIRRANAPSPRPCQWIDGEPAGDDSCKCGAQSVEGRPYCAEHQARAYVPGTSMNAKSLRDQMRMDNRISSANAMRRSGLG